MGSRSKSASIQINSEETHLIQKLQDWDYNNSLLIVKVYIL